MLLLTSTLMSQNEFRDGYIINNSGDTLFGQVNYRGELFMARECIFKDTISNTSKTLLPDDIAAYRFVNGKYYVSKEIGDNKVFLEFLINGEVDIYFWRNKYGDHYFIENDKTGLTEIPYNEGIKYIDNKPVYLESTKHTGVLLYYMQDAPELQSQIKSMKKPDHKNLTRLAEDYHNIVCKDEDCIIYESNKKPIEFELYIEGGYLKLYFDNVSTVLKQKDPLNLNLSFYVSMPRVNENLYFKTGIQYKGIIADTGNVKYTVLTFPFALEYRFQRKKFQPTLGFGFGFEKVKWFTYFLTSANFGFKYKMDRIYLSSILNADIRTSFSPVVPASTWLSIYFNVGIGFRL